MSTPQTGDIILVPVYNQEESESASVEIQWQQTLMSRSTKYYTVRAKNQTQGNSDVLLYVQERFYKDESSPDFIDKIPDCKKEGDHYVAPLNDHFQYGQKNKDGENRWVVLHDKGNKVFQHRFMVTTIQGKVADWAKTLAKSFGAGAIAEAVTTLGPNFIGDYLHTF